MKRLYRVRNASHVKTALILDTPLSECSSEDFTLGPIEMDSVDASYFVQTAVDDGYDVPTTVYYEYRNVYFRGVLVGRIGGAYDPDEDDSWVDDAEYVENIWENGYVSEAYGQTVDDLDSWFLDDGIDKEFDELVECPEDYSLNADSTLRDFFIVQEMDLEPFELLDGTTAAIKRSNHRSAKRSAMKKRASFPNTNEKSKYRLYERFNVGGLEFEVYDSRDGGSTFEDFWGASWSARAWLNDGLWLHLKGGANHCSSWVLSKDRYERGNYGMYYLDNVIAEYQKSGSTEEEMVADFLSKYPQYRVASKKQAVNTRFVPHWDMDYSVIDYKIYQITTDWKMLYPDEKHHPWRFEDWDWAIENGFDFGDYRLVYEGELRTDKWAFNGIDMWDVSANEVLEELYKIFNINQPRDYFGSSMSCSDIIYLDGRYYYCDPIGFKDITEYCQNRYARVKKANYGLQEGDILVSHWGYEANLSDFYQVLRASDKSVWVQRLETIEKGDGGYLSWTTTPLPGQFKGEPMRKKIHWSDYRNEPYIELSSFERAYLWDGEPTHNYDWH